MYDSELKALISDAYCDDHDHDLDESGATSFAEIDVEPLDADIPF